MARKGHNKRLWRYVVSECEKLGIKTEYEKKFAESRSMLFHGWLRGEATITTSGMPYHMTYMGPTTGRITPGRVYVASEGAWVLQKRRVYLFWYLHTVEQVRESIACLHMIHDNIEIMVLKTPRDENIIKKFEEWQAALEVRASKLNDLMLQKL